MPIDVRSILSQLENGIVDLAKTTVKDFANQAATDGKQLLTTMKDDLVRWIQLLADGKITKAEFETLLLGQKDLIAMSALKQAGLALARIDEFKSAVFNLIINTVTGLI
jgi:hypothetical protein